MYDLRNSLYRYKGNVIARIYRNISNSYIFLNLRDYLFNTIFRKVRIFDSQFQIFLL